MAEYGWDDVKIEVDNSGGTPVDLSDYIETLGGFKVTPIIEEHTPAGSSWVGRVFTGIKNGEPVPCTGWYDDTADTGPVAVLNSPGSERTLTVTWGSTNTRSAEVLLGSFNIVAKSEAMTRFEIELLPNGEVSDT